MRRFLLLSQLLLVGLMLCAQEPEKYLSVDAQSLTIVNKLMNTSHPYYRLDSEKYSGMTESECLQSTFPTGLAVAFRTDSPFIGVDVCYQRLGGDGCSSAISIRGFDLYMKAEDGKWKWAGGGRPSSKDKHPRINLINDAEPLMHDCLLYLPLFSSIDSLAILVKEGNIIEAIENPFKGRIVVFGSSFTHGSGSSRPGMTYSAQLERMTGRQFINMGFSGNSKLQQYFATALLEADADAYIFDAFSNPTPEQVKERLIPFIKRFTAEKPGVPLIFLQTIWREKRNFSDSYEQKECRKMETADSLMKKAVAKYKDVYWIDEVDISRGFNECTTDGTHPDSHGYRLWAESILAPVESILSKYGY